VTAAAAMPMLTAGVAALASGELHVAGMGAVLEAARCALQAMSAAQLLALGTGEDSAEAEEGAAAEGVMAALGLLPAHTTAAAAVSSSAAASSFAAGAPLSSRVGAWCQLGAAPPARLQPAWAALWSAARQVAVYAQLLERGRQHRLRFGQLGYFGHAQAVMPLVSLPEHVPVAGMVGPL